MGIGLWLLAGGLAAATARLVRRGRDRYWLAELAAAVVTAVLLGVVATALDFGGWNEPDWRAGLFSLVGGFAAAGLVRLVRMRSPARGRSPRAPLP